MKCEIPKAKNQAHSGGIQMKKDNIKTDVKRL
jgi:hypothetical protein